MDCTPNPHIQGHHRPTQRPPNPHQPSWTGPPADVRTERLLAHIECMTAQAIELATAAKTLALQQIAATPAKPVASRQTPQDQDPTLTFTRLFHLVTRAIVLEAHVAEQRRTQDQRDRLANHRATGADEHSRRTRSRDSVRTIVANALAAAGLPQAAYQQALNHRMADPDTAALFVNHTAAEIAGQICRDLDIPLPPAPTPQAAPSTPSWSQSDDPDPSPAELFPAELFPATQGARSPDELSACEMDALLASILTHPSLDRPASSAKPP